jgi:hypothetical protein
MRLAWYPAGAGRRMVPADTPTSPASLVAGSRASATAGGGAGWQVSTGSAGHLGREVRNRAGNVHPVAGLQAKAMGQEFFTWRGGVGSSIVDLNKDLVVFTSPLGGGKEYVAVPAISPDWAFLHLGWADKYGNRQHPGARFGDRIMARAAGRVALTVERLVPNLRIRAENATVPAQSADREAQPAAERRETGIPRRSAPDTGRSETGIPRRWNALEPGFHGVPADPAHPDREADGADVT